MEQVVKCPHCNSYLIIEKLNCGIFRDACFLNGEPIDPHSSREQIEIYQKNNMIVGCGNPFRIVEGIVEKCGYI